MHEGFPGITNVSRPSLQPFLVQNGSGAAVVIAPGGGSYLEFQKEGSDVAKRFNELGISAFLLKYRVPLLDPHGGHERRSAPLQDMQRAFGVIRSRAAEFGVNASRLGVLGFSAGGALGSDISFYWRKRLYGPVDEADDESCRPDFTLLIYGTNYYEASPEEPQGAVAASNPPLFMAQAADDTVIAPSTLRYYSDAIAAGVPSPTLHVYPKGAHGFGICQKLPERFRRFEECCEWPLHALRFLQDNGFMPGFPGAESESFV